MRKILFAIIFIIITLTVVGFVGVNLYLRSKQADPQLMTNTDITTWKTYTNKNLGFSLKYPSNWDVYESPEKELISFSPPGVNTDDADYVDLDIIPSNTRNGFSIFRPEQLTSTTLAGRNAKEVIINEDKHEQFFDYIQINNISGTKWNQFNEIEIFIDNKQNFKFLPTLKKILTTLELD